MPKTLSRECEVCLRSGNPIHTCGVTDHFYCFTQWDGRNSIVNREFEVRAMGVLNMRENGEKLEKFIGKKKCML